MSLIADVVAGTVITVSWGNAIRDQVIATFATEATRNSTLTAPAEGRYADIADVDALTRYNGATWDVVATKPIMATLSADAAGITTNTVLADVAGISIPVTANRVYWVNADLIYTAAGGAGAGQVKFGWTAPAGATFSWTNIGLVVNGASGVSGTPTFDVSTLADSRSYGAAGSGTPVHVVVFGKLTIAGTAGNFRLQAAQAASSATATTVRSGTTVSAHVLS